MPVKPRSVDVEWKRFYLGTKVDVLTHISLFPGIDKPGSKAHRGFGE